MSNQLDHVLDDSLGGQKNQSRFSVKGDPILAEAIGLWLTETATEKVASASSLAENLLAMFEHGFSYLMRI
jgi:hypothetical protein